MTLKRNVWLRKIYRSNYIYRKYLQMQWKSKSYTSFWAASFPCVVIRWGIPLKVNRKWTLIKNSDLKTLSCQSCSWSQSGNLPVIMWHWPLQIKHHTINKPENKSLSLAFLSITVEQQQNCFFQIFNQFQTC